MAVTKRKVLMRKKCQVAHLLSFHQVIKRFGLILSTYHDSEEPVEAFANEVAVLEQRLADIQKKCSHTKMNAKSSLK